MTGVLPLKLKQHSRNAPATMQAATDMFFDNLKRSDELILYLDNTCVHTADVDRNIKLIKFLSVLSK